jgi:hypothetical protein
VRCIPCVVYPERSPRSTVRESGTGIKSGYAYTPVLTSHKLACPSSTYSSVTERGGDGMDAYHRWTRMIEGCALSPRRTIRGEEVPALLPLHLLLYTSLSPSPPPSYLRVRVLGGLELNREIRSRHPTPLPSRRHEEGESVGEGEAKLERVEGRGRGGRGMEDRGKSESGGEMGVGVRVRAIAQRKKEDTHAPPGPVPHPRSVSISTSARVHLHLSHLHLPPSSLLFPFPFPSTLAARLNCSTMSASTGTHTRAPHTRTCLRVDDPRICMHASTHTCRVLKPRRTPRPMTMTEARLGRRWRG